MAIKAEKFVNLRQLGKGGLNTLDDPQDIQDIEVSDAQNVTFNSSVEIRPGSTLKWPKPVGETNPLLCLFAARDSIGTNYAIAVYAPNFYLRDETNDQWIKINQDFTPTVDNILLMYSYVNWNAGRGADVLYACNGTDKFIKWPICFSTTTSNALSTDTTLTVNDATFFPASGNLVIQVSGGTPFKVAYTSKSGNVFTLTATLTQDVSAGAGVTCQIAEVSGMVKGKVLAKHQRRLFVANNYGGEATMSYSNTELPEDFSTGSGVTKGGSLILSDGNGGITLLNDFGQYLIIGKEDAIFHFEFNYNSALDAKLDTIFPVVSDTSMGPSNIWSVIKKNKEVYYPTLTEGIFTLAPQVTGLSTTVGVTIKSQKIQPLVETLSFASARVASFEQQILWSCATNTVNDTVLVYDALLDYWTRFNNWNVKDWLSHDKELLFGSRIDNNIYQALSDNFDDDENPYDAYILTKRFDFGEASLPKTATYLYVQGYISSTTILYFDVYLNENGILTTLHYSIDGSGALSNQPISEALAMIMLGAPIMGMGSTEDLDEVAIFRAYLALPIRYGFYNMQIKASSSQAGAYWSLTGIAINPELISQVPPTLVAGLIGDDTGFGSLTDSGSTSPISTPVTEIANTIAYAEVPDGVVDGSNRTFTLSHYPVSPSSVIVTLQGIVQNNGSDFVVTGNTIVFTVAPTGGMGVFAYYNSISSTSPSVVYRVPVSGIINGSNTVFTIPSEPENGILFLSLGRQEQIEAVDFNISGKTITYVEAPAADLANAPHYAIIY